MILYKENFGIFSPNSTGAWLFQPENPNYLVGNGPKDYHLRVWPLGNGLFSKMSTEPRAAYMSFRDRFIPKADGRRRIKGIYPFYTNDYGEPVFLDVKREFSLRPVDFIAEVQIFYRTAHQNALEASNKVAVRKIRAQKFTFDIKRINSHEYYWKIFPKTKKWVAPLASGTELTRRLAEKVVAERIAFYEQMSKDGLPVRRLTEREIWGL